MSEEHFFQGMLPFPGSTPSWQTHGQGYAELHYMGHDEAKWLTLSQTESGEKSSRKTVITLKEPRHILELAQACLRALGVPDEIRAKVTIAALDVEKKEG